LGPIKVLLTDFERTLVRLFEDCDMEKQFHREVWDLCRARGVPSWMLMAGGTSPYSLWKKVYRWMRWLRRRDPLSVERMYHAMARIATTYEMDAAGSARLFDDVPPVLERLKSAGIPVVIVSNNATEAVRRILKENNAEDLVGMIIGREYKREFVANLKPRPLLVMKALELSGCHPDNALIVGDSVDDMRAGLRAGIRHRIGLLEHSTASNWQLRKAGADPVLRRFGDLLALLPDGDKPGAH
jgi:HAD superfamily hydrolase (TIGR01549 family)